MRRLFSMHGSYWERREFRRSVLVGVVFLSFSLVANFFAGRYADRMASNYVSDIFLDNFQVRDVDGILIYGILAFVAFVAFLLIKEPRRIPFVLKSFSLFYLIRSMFLTFTHIATYPLHVSIDQAELLSSLIDGNTLFFSGHTGLPFLVALIFWRDRQVRYVSLATSVIMGVSVLLGHIHYTIDVAAAFFITYTIYHLSLRFFRKDHEIFDDKKIIF